MRKLNLFYVISIITLVFMLFIFFSTLKVSGWFERHAVSPAKQMRYAALGQYHFKDSDTLSNQIQLVEVVNQSEVGEQDWLIIVADTISMFQVKVSNFEDGQVLLELFELDSSGLSQRLEGCELLLTVDESGKIHGSTIGDFCGFRPDSQVYIALALELDDSNILIQIESRRIEDQATLELKEYLLERIDPR